MRITETAASVVGVMRLAFDAGAALLSIVVAVPVAFAVSRGTAFAHGADGDIATTNAPAEEQIHDLGTVVEMR
ncbi:hypothetical protein FND50_24980 [Rhodococcus sp. WB9]|uniref:hypothetical protein n=1 Tax=Rhodococcus sp. WB9 TaxID=2594007 RepID=UPI001185BA91|nr:hypothetical protein [Rhodococcus sp. WB9]QDQ93687.1 hypothetical protein FND50_24980 [Rhodococcus sp. WB9]